jgi:SAM-dependent methyltransferase
MTDHPCCHQEGAGTDYGDLLQATRSLRQRPDAFALFRLWLESQGYAREDLLGLPPEVLTMTFGAGNPLALAQLRPGETVVDVGCGAGLDLLLAARLVGPEGVLYGIDPSPIMLEVARRNVEAAGVRNVELLRGEAQEVPLPDGVADHLLSNCVFSCCGVQHLALAEAHRVLRPGGVLQATDVPPSAGGQWSPEDYRRHLEEAGFTEVEVLAGPRILAPMGPAQMERLLEILLPLEPRALTPEALEGLELEAEDRAWLDACWIETLRLRARKPR